MHNPRLAGRYAKSLVDLAVERNQLEQVHEDMQYLRSVIKGSREFAALLRSPVVPVDMKSKAVNAVVKPNVSELTGAFTQLLISKNREINLPEIVEAFIDQYNLIKGINKVKLTTAVPVSDEVKNSIIAKIKRDTSMQNIQLDTVLNEDLIGGFVLEFNNNIVDASVAHDLRSIKKQFSQNVYVKQIR